MQTIDLHGASVNATGSFSKETFDKNCCESSVSDFINFTCHVCFLTPDGNLQHR